MTYRSGFHATRRPDPSVRECPRCGVPIEKGTKQCRDCYSTERFDTMCATHGIDIESLTDDQWERISRASKQGGSSRTRAYKTIAAEQQARREHPSMHGRAAA